ncbi:hypothetical protein ACFQ3B_01210 [Stackebrandtia endophytica]|nr:hypothetical protein [Stackebrandtia endophytica]
MASIDELTAMIAVTITAAEQTGSNTTSALGKARELSSHLAGLGADGTAGNINAVAEKLDEAGTHLASFIETCRQASQMAEAAKTRTGLLTTNATSTPPGRSDQITSRPTSSTVRPSSVPATWSLRDADNAKGHVWQRPDTTGNADMVRVMSPSPRYPHGYMRYYNSHGQPIGINGKPGSRAETHIPINPDGTHQTPQGWNHA